MNGPELPQILKQVEAISTAAAQASQDFSSLHSPATEYEANWTAIQAKLDNAWERGLGCSSLADRSDIQKEIVTLAHAQEALKAEYEANLEAANSRYEARLNRVLPRLCEELVQILGPILVEKALRDLFRATDAPRDGSPGDPEDANPQDDRPSQGVKRKQRRLEGATRKRQRQTKSDKPRSRRRQRRPSATSVASLPRRHTRQRDGSPRRELLDAITPGEVYLAYWGRSKALLAVLLLPTEGLDRVGVHNETIETLGLLREVPLCYDYNPDSGSLNWRQGYRDGEALVPDREYPVMYFDGNAFPTRSQVGWVAASDLLDFDLKAIGRTIPNYRQVRKYLEMRDQGRPQGPNTVSLTHATGAITGNFSSISGPKSPAGESAPSECPQQHHSPAITAVSTAETHDFPRQEIHECAGSRRPSVPASDPMQSVPGIVAGASVSPGRHARNASAGDELFNRACLTVRASEPTMEGDTMPQVPPVFDEWVPGAHDAWDNSLANVTMVAAEAECFLCQQEAEKQGAQDEPVQATPSRLDTLNKQPTRAELSPEHELMSNQDMAQRGQEDVSGDSMQLRLLQDFLASTDQGQSYSDSLDRLLELLTPPRGSSRRAHLNDDDDAFGSPPLRDDTSVREGRSRTLSCNDDPNPQARKDDERQPILECRKVPSPRANKGSRPPLTDDLRLPPIRDQREPTVHLPSFPDRPPTSASCGTGICNPLRPLLPKPLTPARI